MWRKQAERFYFELIAVKRLLCLYSSALLLQSYCIKVCPCATVNNNRTSQNVSSEMEKTSPLTPAGQTTEHGFGTEGSRGKEAIAAPDTL